MSEFLTVEGLSHVAIRTHNIMDSVRYYTEVLGMREAFRMCREDGTLATVYLTIAPGQFLELFADGVREGITGPDVIGINHICLMTKDVRKSYDAVLAADGPLDSEVKRGQSQCWMFWTHDPDGTQIEIMEMPPESMQAQADKKLWANSIQDNESAYTTNQKKNASGFCRRTEQFRRTGFMLPDSE